MAKSAADEAYEAAIKEIRRVRQARETTLFLIGAPYRALERIPQEIATLSALQTLYLDQTAIIDVAPLAALTALRTLYLKQTAVRDLAPLATLAVLQTLTFNQTAVSDLAPLAPLTALQWLSLDQTAVSDLAPSPDWPTWRTLCWTAAQWPTCARSGVLPNSASTAHLA